MNVLLVRPDGIGDEILCLPVATALRRLVPDARITFLSTQYAAPILDHHPDLDANARMTILVAGQAGEPLDRSPRFFAYLLLLSIPCCN